VTLVPEAVIEVISQGYEFKDLELGPMFYLSQGVKDVVVLDPRSKAIIHSRRDGVVRLESPAKIQLECGCKCMV
jgi:Putative restriction endonuclease